MVRNIKNKKLYLGKIVDKERRAYIDPKTRSTHMHIIGSTGEGKSKFMEHMIREDIRNNNGLCLIDPHGHLYQDIVRWCETQGFLDRTYPKKIILFDPSEEDWTFGFNPLQVGDLDIAFHVDAMVKAVGQVWGGEDQDRTPRLKRSLRVLFHTLAENKLSMRETSYLIDQSDEMEKVRTYLSDRIRDETIRNEWNNFNAMSTREFNDFFESTRNRLMEFLSSHIIRTIIGQITNTIDMRRIMDDGYVLLVNLAAADKISDDNARLLGTLLVNDLLMKARGRPEGARPFYLYIDECGYYINEDFEKILTGTRKFGLHAILAHQTLAQLEEAGKKVYQAVMNSAKTKVIFGGLSAEEARIMAEQVFLGELDLEEPVKALIKPVVVDYVKIWARNYTSSTSTSRGESEAEAESSGRTSGRSKGGSRGTGRAMRIAIGPDGQPMIIHSDSESESESKTSGFTRQLSRSRSTSRQEAESHAEGATETFVPVLKELPSQIKGLDVQLHRAMALMVNQPTRHYLLKLPKQKTKRMKSPFIKPGIANDKRVENFKVRCFEKTHYTRRYLEAENSQKTRQIELKQKAIEYHEPPEPKSFRQ